MEVISTDDYPHGLAVKRRAPGPTSWGRKWSQDKVWGGINSKADAGWRAPAKRERWVGQEREERLGSNV